MRRWLQTVFVCIGAGLIPVSVQDAQAEQLPDDVNSVSRSRLPFPLTARNSIRHAGKRTMRRGEPQMWNVTPWVP
ncbi:MAG: hypothetical protein Ct9H300mP25_13710 [Acidobacteriota bacterium]|nr:MAG: hypothetical protein Ct9H300mP25_13710 [Acidobacteriota bacterium]